MVFDIGIIRRPKIPVQLLGQLPMVDRSIFTPRQMRTPQIDLLEGRATENNASYVRRISEAVQIAGQKAIDFAKQCRADYLQIKEYERIGRVMNPYRQSNPSSFRAMRFAYDVSEYAVSLAGEAKVYAGEFIDSHPKLRAGLDAAAAKTKEASQKIYEFAEPMVLKAKDYAFQCLSDYLKAKEERESIAEYESGPMALGINWLPMLDGTNIDQSEKSARKSAEKLLRDFANLSKERGQRLAVLDGRTNIPNDNTELIDAFVGLGRSYRKKIFMKLSTPFKDAIDLAFRVREGTIKRSLIPEEEFGHISGIFKNTNRVNLRLNGNFLDGFLSNSRDKSIELDDRKANIIAQLFGVEPIRDTYDPSIEFEDQRTNPIALLNVDSGTKHLLKDSLDIVHTLRTHSSWFVRATLAGNPYISEETANKLMEDENPIVRGIIAKKFGTSATLQIQTLQPA